MSFSHLLTGKLYSRYRRYQAGDTSATFLDKEKPRPQAEWVIHYIIEIQLSLQMGPLELGITVVLIYTIQVSLR